VYNHYHFDFIGVVHNNLTDTNHCFLGHVTSSTLNRSVTRHAVNTTHITGLSSGASPQGETADTLVRLHSTDVTILLTELTVGIKETLDRREHREVLINKFLGFFDRDVKSVGQLVRPHAVG